MAMINWSPCITFVIHIYTRTKKTLSGHPVHGVEMSIEHLHSSFNLVWHVSGAWHLSVVMGGGGTWVQSMQMK